MTRMYQRLGGLMVLGITAGVSMLAGGVLLSGASADEPDSPPAAAVRELTSAEGVIFSSAPAEGVCLIRFNGDFEASSLAPATASLAIAGQTTDPGTPVFSIAGGAGEGVTTFPNGAGVEVRELTAEELEELKSTMQELRLGAEAGECEVIEAKDGVFTTSAGTITLNVLPGREE